jgi:hypothetical protein
MSAHEHDFEPVRGLPGKLPEGEEILWHGAPSWSAFAVHAMHLRLVLLYFGLIIVARGLGGALPTESGSVLARTAGEAVWTAALGLAAVGLLCLYSWLVARTSVYTITSRRVVLRVGVAIPKAVNLPFAIIESAAIRQHPDGTGDIPLSLKPSARAGYVLLWPHARPWRWSRPEPMLRAVPNAALAAKVLADALKAYSAAHVNAPTWQPSAPEQRPTSKVTAPVSPATA